jgi:hypothetical protein
VGSDHLRQEAMQIFVTCMMRVLIVSP